MESLAGHDGYETLWAKLRTSLMESFTGYFLQMILNMDKRLEVEDKRLTGRQIVWLMVRKFEIDTAEGAVLQ